MTPGKGTVLTEKQAEELDRLSGLPQRTEKQELTYQTLLAKKNAPPELSDTAKSYLKAKDSAKSTNSPARTRMSAWPGSLIKKRKSRKRKKIKCGFPSYSLVW